MSGSTRTPGIGIMTKLRSRCLVAAASAVTASFGLAQDSIQMRDGRFVMNKKMTRDGAVILEMAWDEGVGDAK